MSCIEPVSLALIVNELSYSESFIDAVLATAGRQNIDRVFGVIAQFNFAYDLSKVSRSVSDDPKFFGAFDWHD